MPNLTVEISVDRTRLDAMVRRIGSHISNCRCVPLCPDYGDDALHNARLLGAYHVRKGWGDNGLYQDWYLSLKAEDTRYIRTYILRGEPGRTDIGKSQPADVSLVGLGAAVDHFNKAIGEFGKALADSFAPILECFSPTPDFEQILIAVERINLRHNLERAFIPSTAACWLARRWPAWALPAVAWMRLRKRWEALYHDA